MSPLFVESSNHLRRMIGFSSREFKTDVPLSPNVTLQDIIRMFSPEHSTTLWLDEECFLLHNSPTPFIEICRYKMHDGNPNASSFDTMMLCQVSGVTGAGAPLPALEYIIERLTSDNDLLSFEVECMTMFSTKTLDVSDACFSRLIQGGGKRRGDITLTQVELSASQTISLFLHNLGSIDIHLHYCDFHEPTLHLAYSSVTNGRDQSIAIEERGRLYMKFFPKNMKKLSVDGLSFVLSNPILKEFNAVVSLRRCPYEILRKFVYALAANKVSTLETVCFECDWLGAGLPGIPWDQDKEPSHEWEKDEEPSMWTALWNAIADHPSLNIIQFSSKSTSLRQLTWWLPIAAAVKANPRLIYISSLGETCNDWNTKLHEHVQPLLVINRYLPKIKALCQTDPSHTAILLGQAITAIARRRHGHVIIQMLMHQLVLTGYDIGGVAVDNVNADV